MPGLARPGPRPCLRPVLYLVDRGLILAPSSHGYPSTGYGPMGQTSRVPLVNTLDVSRDESETSPRRVPYIDEVVRPSRMLDPARGGVPWREGPSTLPACTPVAACMSVVYGAGCTLAGVPGQGTRAGYPVHLRLHLRYTEYRRYEVYRRTECRGPEVRGTRALPPG